MTDAGPRTVRPDGSPGRSARTAAALGCEHPPGQPQARRGPPSRPFEHVDDIHYSPQDGGVEPKKAKATTFRDKTRGRAQELVASCTRLKRKAENQFVVEGEEKVLAATTGDVEVLRSYAKAAKRSGAPIKLGGGGTVGAQASHLTGQLEQFFRDHNSGSDTFTPGRK